MKFKNLAIGDSFEVYGDQHINYDHPKICKCIKIDDHTAKEVGGIQFLMNPDDEVQELKEDNTPPIQKIPIGKRVFGKYGLGTVTAHEVGKHDIHVEYENGASCLHCQDPNCKEFDSIIPANKVKAEDCPWRYRSYPLGANAQYTYPGLAEPRDTPVFVNKCNHRLNQFGRVCQVPGDSPCLLLSFSDLGDNYRG